LSGQVAEPGLDGGYVNGGVVHVLAFVVAGRDGAELFELVERPFDGVALLVAVGVEGVRASAGRPAASPVGLLVGLLRDRCGDPAPA
jgi:hypothetical protein